MMKIQPVVGHGKFQWHLGGWFGGVFGGTAWTLPLAVFLAANGDTYLAIVPLATALFTICIAYSIWTRRDQIDPYVAIQSFLAVLAIAVPINWYAVDYWGSPNAMTAMHYSRSQWGWTVAVVPTTMALLAVQQWLVKWTNIKAMPTENQQVSQKQTSA